MQDNKPRILMVSHLPPPPEGTAKINEMLVNSEHLNEKFILKFISLKKRNRASERGRFAFQNVVDNIFNITNFIIKTIVFSPGLIYLTLAQNKLGFFRDSLFILVARLLRKKICVHFHGGNFDLFYNGQNVFIKRYIRFVIVRADRLILLAEKFKKHWTPLLRTGKMRVLYNCLPRLNTNVSSRGGTDRVATILFIGYLSKAKGALDTVYSIPLVISDYKRPVDFILCGQPLDTERNITFIPQPHNGYSKIKEFIREQKLEKYCKIYTSLDAETKEKLFSCADMFVFPTYSEGCGLVVLEAMANGLPVITTAVGALEEMLVQNKNCIFVQPGNHREIADAILYLFNNKRHAYEMGQNNKRLVYEKYNQQRYVQNMADIWLGM